MRPFRLFVILVLLTVSALAVVYLRVASVRTAHRIQVLYDRQAALRYRVWSQQAEIAKKSGPAWIENLIHTESIPVREPRLSGSAPGKAPAKQEWETD